MPYENNSLTIIRPNAGTWFLYKGIKYTNCATHLHQQNAGNKTQYHGDSTLMINQCRSYYFAGSHYQTITNGMDCYWDTAHDWSHFRFDHLRNPNMRAVLS